MLSRQAATGTGSATDRSAGPLRRDRPVSTAFVLSFSQAMSAELRGREVHVLAPCPVVLMLAERTTYRVLAESAGGSGTPTAVNGRTP